MKYDSVIFDLDGTLLDTLDDLRDSVNFALRAHGLPERTLPEIRCFVGNGVGNLVKRSAGDVSEKEVDEILATFRSHYKDHSSDKTKPYEGIIGLLSSLRERGIPTAVVSNKIDSAVRALIPEYFGDLIDVAIGELEGVKRKPAPDTVRLAMERLCVSCPVYVGDSEVDVQTAKNAGIDGIFVTWGFRSEDELRAAGAERLVKSPDELKEALL
ncbi:MAG: HAD family hydrolase [Ruminococcaceae bacterium]|nr:HAD family hydrolase [Oscillospiraceae bacterium]